MYSIVESSNKVSSAFLAVLYTLYYTSGLEL